MTGAAARRSIHGARESGGQVVVIRDHFRLRLRPPGDDAPAHEPGTDSRSYRPDPDTANLSVMVYRYRADGLRGCVATFDALGRGGTEFLADDAALARAHAADDARYGYTPLPEAGSARIEWSESYDRIAVRIQAAAFAIEAELAGLGPPTFISGSHPRDDSIAYVATMREAVAGSLSVSGRVVPGQLFLHAGYEPWIGRSARSGAAQLGETFVALP